MIKAVLTDIEGTTSSLSFVKDVLFPYARQHMQDFILQHEDSPAVSKQLNEIRKLQGQELTTNSIIEQLHAWIDQDKKVTPLKTLQGLLWEKGYQQGDFKGHVYQDAYDQLKHWHAEGIKLYVYSSGSVYAQQLLFGHSDFGNMTPLFDAYYDTTIGHKQDRQSYLNIIADIKLPADQILFLSDIEQELDAAHAAGMKTGWLLREGDLNIDASHKQLSDFKEITI